MEPNSVKSECDDSVDQKPYVRVPECLPSVNYINIAPIKTEEDWKPTGCPPGVNSHDGFHLPRINTTGNIQRWTVSSSVIIPVDVTENNGQVSDDIVENGDRSVDRVQQKDGVKIKDKGICGFRLCEINKHTGHLAVIPNVTIVPAEPPTDSDVLLSPLSSNIQFNNNSSWDSEVTTSSVPTSIPDGKDTTDNFDNPLYEEHSNQLVTLSTSRQTPRKEMSEYSNVILQPQAGSVEKPFTCHGNRFSNCDAINVHHPIHTGAKLYRCDVCNKEFCQTLDLISHQCIHTGEKPTTCDVCDRTFTRSSSLIAHQRIHTGEKPYKCDVCDKTFTRSSGITIHQHTHTGERPYKCDICDKEFSRARGLRDHRYIHEGMNPYKCDVCKKELLNSSDLCIHLRIHTDDKPYMCDVCDRTFARSSNLIIHQRIHTGEKPYKCNVCSTTFRSSSEVIRHLRTQHTAEKPYKCDVCDKTFARPSFCKIHQRIHRGERPFKCEVCNKTYITSSGVKKHLRTHTGNLQV